jgi:hypothetical protein
VARRHRSGGTGSVAVRFDDHDGAFGQHAFNPGKDVEERIDTFVDRIADAAQQQDAWPGCTGQREDGAEIGVGSDQDAVVVGVPGSAEDPDMGGVMPGRGQPVSHCILQGLIDQQPHAV